ncbi:MAG: VC0807 family protein [Verrucomicrobiota bacterium]
MSTPPPRSTQQENPLANILINVLIPVVALSFLSKEEGKVWQIGPVWGMAVAIAMPLGYGLWDFIKQRKLNPFSILGFVSVLLSGGITLYVWKDDGTIDGNAALLFAIKEALIPLVLGAAIFFSHRTATPLVRVFLYNPDLFDVKKIEQKVKEAGRDADYRKLLFTGTLLMTGSFVLSAAMNFFLALWFLGEVDTTSETARVDYNEAVGRLTGWGFLVIGVPILAILMFGMWKLLSGLKKLTGLETEEVLLPR